MDRWVRRSLLGGIVAVAVLVRLLYVARHATDDGWNDMVLVYGNVALNILHGHGYVETLSAAAHRLADTSTHLLPMRVLDHMHSAAPQRPAPYYLPGYPSLIALLWWATDRVDYAVPQIAAAVCDGVVGPLALWAILTAAGQRWAALVGALLGAASLPLIGQSVYVMPDTLALDCVLGALALLCWSPRASRPWLLAIAAGLLVGLGTWLRGDVVLFVPAALLATLLVWPRDRGRVSVALVGAAVVPMLALSLFYATTYGAFHLTRPGLGLLLWEGMAQAPNQWGVVAASAAAGGADGTARLLLQRHGLVYGSWTGDSFLLHRALGAMDQDPGWFVAPVRARLWRVITVEGTIAPGILLLAGGGWLTLWHRSRHVAALLFLIWLSRVLPFALMRDEERFLLILVPIYGICVPVGAAGLVAWLRERVRFSRLRVIQSTSS